MATLGCAIGLMVCCLVDIHVRGSQWRECCFPTGVHIVDFAQSSIRFNAHLHIAPRSNGILPIFISFDHIWSHWTLVLGYSLKAPKHFSAFFRHTHHTLCFSYSSIWSLSLIWNYIKFQPTVSLSLPEFQRQIDKIAKVSSALMENVPSLESFRNLLLGDSKTFIPQSYHPQN